MSAAADRNLLFGILALQMDFISRDQLVEGMHAWVLHKERPLGDLLVERGVLAAEDHALLTPMVERHIEKHGDAGRSLAALEMSDSTNAALVCVVDHDVRASLAHLSPRPAHPHATPMPEAVTDGPARYVIERSHAQGGLGEVFVARDRELNRRVALKQIQAQHADDPLSQSRFLLEGEVTGGLEHPGIVPVYGAGRHADGRPYYVMRFVEGETLRDAIRQFHAGAKGTSASDRNLGLRELLDRFLDVCDAVAYAHRRGVLHRDLKPANILLGDYGETLVIDWGLAKVLGRTSNDAGPEDQDTTRPGCQLLLANEALPTVGHAVHGTPGYLSPEQAGGRIGELGPATDVYSLGAILFHILTGRPPLTREDGDILGRTSRGDLPSVRQFNPGVSPALEAVCRRALTLRPQERYPDVQGLAADVRRWLADEPVSAWRESPGVRLRRWVRKHPRRVAGTAAALLVGLIAAGVGAVLLEVKNQDLADTNQKLDSAITSLQTTNASLDRANDDLKKALANEEAARRRADDRTRLANDRFSLALGTIESQVAYAHQHLTGRSGTEDFRMMLMARSIAGLQELVREHEKSQRADRSRAVAHVTMGDILLRYDVRSEKAYQEYQTAHEIFKALLDANPQDAAALRDLALSHERVGNSLKKQGKLQKSVEQYQQALGLAQRLAEPDPGSAEGQRHLADLHETIGKTCEEQGESQKAVEQYQQALSIRRRLAKADPKNAKDHSALSATHNTIGKVLLARGEVAKALEQFHHGYQICQRLADADPKDLSAQRDLSGSRERIGDILRRMGAFEQAHREYEESLKIRQRLAEVDSKNAQAQSDLSSTHLTIGDLLLEQRQAKQALEQFQKALKIRQRLAEADPKDASAQDELFVSQSKAGDALLELEELQRALEQYQEAFLTAQRLALADPKHARPQENLVVAHDRIGTVLLQQGEVPKALREFQEGLKIALRLSEADPSNFEAQTEVVGMYFRIGRAEEELFRHAEAIATFEKALAVLRPWQEAGKLKGTRFADWPRIITRGRDDCRLALRALGDLEPLLKLKPKQAVELLGLRAELLARQGKHADAMTATDKLVGLPEDVDQHYLVARAYAYCARDRANEDRHARRSLLHLQKAREAGFFKESENIKQLKESEGFKLLLSREEFKRFLAELEEP
jgi:eukaryotic-like serine/threonine-protein kinase